jgi:hypothetical protein
VHTTTRIRRIAAAAAGVLALGAVVVGGASARPAAQTAPGDPLDPRTYASGNAPFLVAHATGVQKYACQPDGTWLFTAPEATLYASTGAAGPIGTHYLAVATGRPVWQANDGSSVEAARKTAASGGAGNIPWLLLESAVTGVGADGDRFAATTWVQRLNTIGGVAPAGSCVPGDRIAVPYAADYFFWRAAHADGAEA